ncbi:hypothetical protein KAJ27_01945 [bacterium]|nr:hypothetical protein [bacterium]
MLKIRCSKCKTKLFKYLKIGKGNVLICWYDRMEKDITIRHEGFASCPCGNIIGELGSKGIKMIKSSFVYSGTKD